MTYSCGCDLALVYTPTWEDVALANGATKGSAARVCFLVQLKTYQRLGYPIRLDTVPAPIVEHIAHSVGVTTPLSIAGYDTSSTRQRHLGVVRAHLQVQPFGPAARRVMLGALVEAARTKHDLADLINVAVEELVHRRYELPAFDTLDRAARHVRAAVDRGLYRQVSSALTPEARAAIDALFIADLATRRTPWNDLKAEPRNPTIAHLKELIAWQRWPTTAPGRRPAPTRSSSPCAIWSSPCAIWSSPPTSRRGRTRNASRRWTP